MEGIEFLIDLQSRIEAAIEASGALKKVQETAARADTATRHFEASTARADHASHSAAGAHRHHSNELVNLGHQFEYVKNGINEFAEAIGLVLVVEGIEKVIDKVMELGAEVLKAGAKAERTRVAFDMFFGKEKGKEALEFAEKFNDTTEHTLEATKGYEMTLARAGFQGEQLKREMRAASDLATRFPNPAEGMEHAVHALANLNSTGKIENRQFRELGLGENGPEKFYAELSRRTGIGVEQLKKDMEKGKVATADSIEALNTIIAGKGGTLGAKGEAMFKTMSSRLAHFSEIPDKIYESVEGSPAWNRFADFIGEISSKLGPKGPLGSKLAEGLGRAFDSISTQLERITPKDISDFIDALVKLPAAITKITEALVKLIPVATSMVSFFGGGPKGADEVLADYSNQTIHGLGARVSKAQGFFAKMKALFLTTNGDLMNDRAAAAALSSGAVKTIEDGNPKVKSATSDMAESAIDGFKDTAQIRSPSKKFEYLGQMSVAGYERGVEGMDLTPPSMSMPAFPSNAARGSSAVTISAPINIQVLGDDGEVVQQIADAVRLEVPSAILSALEQMGLGVGAS